MDLVYHRFRGFDSVTDRVQKTSLMLGLLRRSAALPRETLVDMARSIPLVRARAAVLKEIETISTPSSSSARTRCSRAATTVADDEYTEDDDDHGTTDSWASSSSGWSTTDTDDDATVATADVFTGDAGFVAEKINTDQNDDTDNDDDRSTTGSSNATFSSSGGTLLSDTATTAHADGLVRSLMARIEVLEAIVLSRR